jgi:hypothetical protein
MSQNKKKSQLPTMKYCCNYDETQEEDYSLQQYLQEDSGMNERIEEFSFYSWDSDL